MTEQLTTIFFCQPTWIEDIRASYVNNEQVQKIREQLRQRPDPKGRFTWSGELLYLCNMLWLGGSSGLQQRVLRAFHDSMVGGHSGFPVTYRHLRRLFAWPKMKECIKNYVQTCVIYQQAKPDWVKYASLLEPIPLPEGAWQVVTMDFIDGLPQSGKANCILVVFDKFTRYAHFLP